MLALLYCRFTSIETNEGVPEPSGSLYGEGTTSATFFGCPRRLKCRTMVGLGGNERCAPFAACIEWQSCICSCLKRQFVLRAHLTPACRCRTPAFRCLICKPPYATAFKSKNALVFRLSFLLVDFTSYYHVRCVSGASIRGRLSFCWVGIGLNVCFEV